LPLNAYICKGLREKTSKINTIKNMTVNQMVSGSSPEEGATKIRVTDQSDL